MADRDGGGASRVSRLALTIAALATAGAAGVSVLFVARPALSPSWWPGRPPLTDLVVAIGTQRTFEARLTGGFAYGPVVVPSARRSGARGGDSLSPDIRLAALGLEKQLESSRNASTLATYGAAVLIAGKADLAVSAFEDAVRLEPKTARLRSDLAAAYLVRFKERNELEDVAKAVDAAAMATASDPNLREGQFNLGLALEALSLRHEARKVWQAYKAMDPRSPWAHEAQAHIDALAPEMLTRRFDEERRLIADAAATGDAVSVLGAVRRNPDVAYDYVENEVIPDWADAWLAGDRSDAEGLLRRAKQIGLALADAVDERLALDAVAVIERERSASTDRTDTLARGHQLFRSARKAYQSGDTAAFGDGYRRARQALMGSQSPFEEWTRLYLGIAEYYRNDLQSAAVPLTPLVSDATARKHWYVAGRTLRMRGLLAGLSGRLSGQLDDYHKALQIFDRLRARGDATGMHASLADTYESLGDRSATWSHIREALAGLDDTRQFGTRTTVLWRAALKATRDDLLHASALLNTEFLDEAQSVAPAVDLAQGHLNRAAVYDQLGMAESAQVDVKAANEFISRVTDPSVRERIVAEAALVGGELTHGDTASAIAPLQASIDYFHRSGMDLRLLRAYLALGRAQSASGRTVDAGATFAAGIEVLERQRARLPSGELRLGYFDLPWSLYDAAIELDARQDDRLDAAAALAERSRARDLLDSWLTRGDVRPVSPVELTRTLPANAAVAYYVALPESVLLWVARRDGASFFRLPIPLDDLTSKVAAFRTAIERGDGVRSAKLAESLYLDLVAPVANALSGTDMLIVAADGPLHALPFAALVDPATKHSLIEDRAVAVTPSATILARNSQSGRRLTPSADALVIGNPQIDARDAVGMASLTEAGLEAGDIAEVYPNVVVLTGGKATKRAFLREAGRFDIVHFAGHAIANDRYPMLSRFFLAREDRDEPGVVFAHEILQVDLSRTSLVVLAACGTAVGPIKKGEGAIGLARPFLARGVPAVIATLWDVDDRASRILFQTFYRALRGGASPARALRTAQIDLLRRPESGLKATRSWAAFTAIGGVDDTYQQMTQFDGGQR